MTKRTGIIILTITIFITAFYFKNSFAAEKEYDKAIVFSTDNKSTVAPELRKSDFLKDYSNSVTLPEPIPYGNINIPSKTSEINNNYLNQIYEYKNLQNNPVGNNPGNIGIIDNSTDINTVKPNFDFSADVYSIKPYDPNSYSNNNIISQTYQPIPYQQDVNIVPTEFLSPATAEDIVPKEIIRAQEKLITKPDINKDLNININFGKTYPEYPASQPQAEFSPIESKKGYISGGISKDITGVEAPPQEVPKTYQMPLTLPYEKERIINRSSLVPEKEKQSNEKSEQYDY